MKIRQLSDSLGPAAHVEIALDGMWETALGLGPKDLPDAERIVDLFIASAEDVAFEVFFEQGDSGIGFLGVRLNGMCAKSRTVAIVRCLAEIAGPVRLALLDVVQHAQQHIHPALFGAEPTLLEVGVVGLWKSVGAVPLWRYGDAALNGPAIAQRLRSNPALFDSQPNPVVLEFGFDQPLPHWIGIQCGRGSGGGFTADVDTVSDRITKFAFGD